MPCLSFRPLHQRNKRLKRALHIALRAVVIPYVLSEFGRIDIDMYDLCSLCKPRGVSCHAVAEPCADSENQVAVVNRHIGFPLPVHSDHTKGQGISSVKGPHAHQGGDHRYVGFFRKFGQFLRRVRDDYAASGIDDRPFRGIDFLCDGANGFHIRGRAAAIGARRFAGRVFAELYHKILGNVHQNRPRTPAGGDPKRVTNVRSQLIHRSAEEAVLRDRQSDADDIDLLKGVLSDHVERDLPGNNHHRAGIHIRGGDSCHRIRCAWPACGKANADLPGGTGITVRGMGSPLLMAG